MIRLGLFLFFIIEILFCYAHYSISAVVSVLDSNAGTHNSIAVDGMGKVHISYGVGGNFHFNPVSALRYATNSSGNWEVTTIDASEGVGGYTSIATDSLNKVHISYYDYTNQDLKYATNASGIWVITTLDSVNDVGKYSSIAIDSIDKIHISYYDYTSRKLKYITNAAGNWISEEISNADNNCFCSISMDSNDKCHICFLSGNALKVINNSTGTWSTTTIENNVSDSSNAGMYTSIKIDSNNHAHISYAHKSMNDLKYATNVSGDWIITTVEDMNGYNGEYSSLGIDSNGKIHISYYDYANGGIKYATNTFGDWVITTIDKNISTLIPYCYTSLAIDLLNKVHISFFDGEGLENNLKYASYSPPVFDATGTWHYSEVNNWASSGCIPDDDEAGILNIMQIGNSIEIHRNSDTIFGSVSGREYYFSLSFYEGGSTIYYSNFELLSNNSGSGEINWKQTNCIGGKDLILSVDDIQPNPNTDGSGGSGGSGGGGGGGGGCFIHTILP
jgi:hypothetical protein